MKAFIRRVSWHCVCYGQHNATAHLDGIVNIMSDEEPKWFVPEPKSQSEILVLGIKVASSPAHVSQSPLSLSIVSYLAATSRSTSPRLLIPQDRDGSADGIL
jgi:hypothetical protein